MNKIINFTKSLQFRRRTYIRLLLKNGPNCFFCLSMLYNNVRIANIHRTSHRQTRPSNSSDSYEQLDGQRNRKERHKYLKEDNENEAQWQENGKIRTFEVLFQVGRTVASAMNGGRTKGYRIFFPAFTWEVGSESCNRVSFVTFGVSTCLVGTVVLIEIMNEFRNVLLIVLFFISII